MTQNLPSDRQLSFSEAIEEVSKIVEMFLINDFSDDPGMNASSHLKKMKQEIRHYFKTGSCDQSSAKAAKSINPTLLQPTTGKWFLHYEACPFQGYLPLPLKTLLKAKNAKNGIIADYCRSELKKLVTEYRKRIDKIMFYFHPCDALDFCYGDLPYKFDIIDTSNLADSFGLASLLNATGRKLLSDRSLLFIESIRWICVAPSLAQYVQELLFCPLSLIPTLYGFRLMDNVEWGQETPRSTRTMAVMPTRLRWKKTMPFAQVALVLTSPLKMTLQRLMDACSYNPYIASSHPAVAESLCRFFSPLTFCYVLSDLIHRGGIKEPTALMAAFFSRLRPEFRKSFETCLAWMEKRPVWRVKVRIVFSATEQMAFRGLKVLGGVTLLRLVLIPTIFLDNSSFPGQLGVSRYTKIISLTDDHFIDNAEVILKTKSSGLIESVDIAFLLEDRSLLESHTGIVIKTSGVIVFFIGPLSQSHHNVKLFNRPYPWSSGNPTSHLPHDTESQDSRLIGESCQETQDAYTIRFKALSGGSSKPLSGKTQFYRFTFRARYKSFCCFSPRIESWWWRRPAALALPIFPPHHRLS